jgi:glycosyltransferase involved in cell wall biosynthesis
MKLQLFSFVFFLFIIQRCAADPIISIITSVYKGQVFIESFLQDIVQQTIFEQCELIIINANSPENEEPIIKKFQAQYPNIIYKKLNVDPGLYGVWNMALEMAHGEFITNANLDDRLKPECYEVYLHHFDKFPQADIVYADFFVTHTPPLCTFLEFPKDKIIGTRGQDFSLPRLKGLCFIGPHPMWRKAMHERVGRFNATFKIAGDWEMWLRAACYGAQFVHIKQALSLYYENPKGLSTATDKRSLLAKENQVIVNCYRNRVVRKK